MIIKGIYFPAGKNQLVDPIDLGRAINRECEFPRLDRLATSSILDPDDQCGGANAQSDDRRKSQFGQG